jgi:hypothetical protein
MTMRRPRVPVALLALGDLVLVATRITPIS